MFVIKYVGEFGFIKPWTAVRDSETFSQQFLTPSIVEGIEKKLFPELLNEKFNGKIMKIKRYRLNHKGLDIQQEKTWSKGGFKKNRTNVSILKRGVMLSVNLYLAFDSQEDVDRAFTQTICLCRNEDLMFPESQFKCSLSEFDLIDGFELIFSDSESGFKVGYNRFDNAAEMFGELKVFGNPIRTEI